MSKVHICDRCGNKLNEPAKFIDFKPIHYILGIETVAFNYWEGEYTSRWEGDLCNSCASELERFLRGQATEECKEE